jgi:hypothetical protein
LFLIFPFCFQSNFVGSPRLGKGFPSGPIRQVFGVQSGEIHGDVEDQIGAAADRNAVFVLLSDR